VRNRRLFVTTKQRSNVSSSVASPTSTANSFRSVMRHVPHPVVVVTTLDCPAIYQDDQSGRLTTRIPEHWADTEVPSTISRTNNMGSMDIIRPLPRAITASSFTSLTLVPAPTILFNVSLPSRSYSAISTSGIFNVHILSADEDGAKVADLFARGYSGLAKDSIGGLRDAGLGMLSGLADHGIKIVGQEQWKDSWAALTRSKSASPTNPSVDAFPAPLLRGPGILHVLKCKLVDLHMTGSIEARHFALVAGQVTDVVSGNLPRDGADSQRMALSYVDGAYRGPSPEIMKHTTTSSSR